MKISQRTHKILYGMHSGVGIWLSVLMCIIAFTGSLSVIEHDIYDWEMKGYNTGPVNGAVDYHAVATDLLAKHATEGHVEFLRIGLPTDDQPGYRYYLFGHLHTDVEGEEGDHFYHVYYQGQEGEGRELSGWGLADFYIRLHANLMLEGQWGRYAVGVIGFLMFILVIGGIFIHGHLIRDFFKFRTERSDRVKWMDAHKVLGLIALPFHLTFSFTGALQGLVTVMLFAIAFVSYGGDIEAAQSDLLGEEAIETGISAPLYDLKALVADSQTRLENFTPEMLFVRYPGDAGAHTQIAGNMTGVLTNLEPVIYNGTTGELKEAGTSLNDGVSQRAISLIAVLHYGRFDGLAMRIVYFILGIAMAVLTATGTMVWIDRRDQEMRRLSGRKDALRDDRLSSFLIAGLAASVPATAATLVTARLVEPGQPAELFAWVGFTSWIVLALAATFILPRGQITKTMYWLGSVLLAGTVGLSVTQFGFGGLETVDMLCLVSIAPLQLYIFRPQHHEKKKRQKPSP